MIGSQNIHVTPMNKVFLFIQNISVNLKKEKLTFLIKLTKPVLASVKIPMALLVT